MKKPVFEGACTAIITPFIDSGIDSIALERQLEFQAENGIRAIVAAGTTGENATLDIHEHNELVDICIKRAKGKMKVIVGVGGNNTAACLKKALSAQDAGADAVLMTPPYYNKTSFEGLIAHFVHVADNISIPLILYNVPSRTSIGISPEAYRILARHPNINGTKEASGSFSLISRTRSECGGELNIWSGNDDNTIAMMSLGAKGIISVLSNILPRETSEICELCLKGDYAAALQIYTRYAKLCDALFIDVNPIPLKAAMKLIGSDSGRLRLPLTELSPEKTNILKAAMSEVGLL